MAKKLNYKKALEEIESIVDEIENGNPDVDKLGDKVKRAVELVKYCKDSLRNMRENIDGAINGLED